MPNRHRERRSIGLQPDDCKERNCVPRRGPEPPLELEYLDVRIANLNETSAFNTQTALHWTRPAKAPYHVARPVGSSFVMVRRRPDLRFQWVSGQTSDG